MNAENIFLPEEGCSYFFPCIDVLEFGPFKGYIPALWRAVLLSS